MRIVHFDVKPINMLIADSCHLLISDFDSSYDMTRSTGPPRQSDFAGTPFYMAPEIRNRIEITTKADVRSLDVLVTTIMYGRLPNVSASLRQFFKACLTDNHKRRLDIDGVKCLDFYKDVNWEEVVACKMEPPYHPSELEFSAALENLDLDPYDPLLLAAAYRTGMPMIDEGFGDTRKKNGVRQLAVDLPNHVELAEAGLTPKKIDELFTNFDFTNPHYLESFHGFDEKQNFSGDDTTVDAMHIFISQGVVQDWLLIRNGNVPSINSDP
ncbi:Serine/threonine-protein kinase Sgk1 [Taenia solium]|eukprot:TsM_001079300 transcript=TsM_001079300 gene=TsM_001079300